MPVDDLLKLFGALSPVFLLVIGAFLKRRSDQALNAKAEADAEVSRVTALKVKAETDSYILENAVKLVEQFKEQQSVKDEVTAARIAVSEEKSSTLEKRILRMEDKFSRLRAVLATHGVWDAAALIDLRVTRPEYPEPPALPDNLED